MGDLVMAEFEPKQFGRFYLLEKLAVGGMAEIYKAKTFGAEGFEKQLAIKRILPHCSADKDFITMLIDEAKLSVVLSHANIVQVYDLGKVGDDYFISMEYINGINLRDVLYRCRERLIPLPQEIAVYIISEVCKGLDYAHRKTDHSGRPLGIVHRDISPQNVLISFEGEVKIVDFGIAKAAMNISHTMAGILKGKIAYMSPEQALGKAIDYRTDLFSTGILLYECLTGDKLFTGESQFEVLKKIRTMKIDVTKLPVGIPKPLQQILVRALAYFPKDRFQSAGDMQIELTKYLYATLPEFSPQKLAASVRTLFVDELERQQRQIAMQQQLQAQTSSIRLPSQTAVQQDLVVRDETMATPTPPGLTATRRQVTGPVTQAETTMETVRAGRGIGARIAAALGAMALIGLGALGYARYLHPRLFPAEPVAPLYGSVMISSSPAGAQVYIDGKDLQKVTPTTIDQLEIDKSYTVKLTKEGHADLEHKVKATSTTPLSIALQLVESGKPPAPAAAIPTSPTEPAPPPATVGTIRVVSTPPGATILLNGRTTGKVTTATIGNLAMNKRYTIGVLKKDFEGWTRSIQLTDSSATVSGELKPKKQAPTAALPPPETPPSTQPAPPEKAPREPATAGGPGSIKVSSNPSGAEVFVNGDSHGRTPATIAGLSGSVKVVLTKEGYAPYSTRVTIKPGETVSLGTVQMGNILGEVSVSSSPSGAMVYIDGEATARTPVTIRKVRRDKGHNIRVTLNGFKTWERSFNFGQEGEKRFHADLQEE
ncbi:MAG: PEGA domain-containing protein [Deltaproteobacteria bacterium]|nr:PEGA domain-containing protein [Deltaproteobacteria bacterium]